MLAGFQTLTYDLYSNLSMELAKFPVFSFFVRIWFRSVSQLPQQLFSFVGESIMCHVMAVNLRLGTDISLPSLISENF